MAEYESVRSISLPEPTPSLAISFTPHGAEYAFVVGEVTFTWSGIYYVAKETTITFTATPKFPTAARSAASYAWDFGDGGTASGAVVTHKFTRSTINLSVVCVMTDNFGTEWTARKSMYVE